MARPKLSAEDTRENFTLRLSRSERAQVEARAKLLGLSLSDYARSCVVQGTVRVIQEEGHDPEKVHQLLLIGNNLNQISKRMHSTGEVDTEKLDAVLSQVQGVVSENGKNRTLSRLQRPELARADLGASSSTSWPALPRWNVS